jgi:hypothetical protein
MFQPIDFTRKPGERVSLAGLERSRLYRPRQG